MAEKVNVIVLKDGPYQLSNVRNLKFDGELQSVEGDIWLCRCGRSANAPFCDGSHNGNFDDQCEPRSPKSIHTWEGRTVRTHFNPNTCMHVFKCQPLKALRAAELAGDDSAADKILKVVATCPSGALTAERTDGGPTPVEPEFDAQVEIMRGGEIRLQCSFDINEPLQERQRDERATLCRCGLSQSKPWCDGRHKKRTDFR